MEHNLLEILGTILGSAGAAWVAVRVEIKWIIKTLERHEDYHNSHFNELKTIERRKKHA